MDETFKSDEQLAKRRGTRSPGLPTWGAAAGGAVAGAVFYGGFLYDNDAVMAVAVVLLALVAGGVVLAARRGTGRRGWPMMLAAGLGFVVVFLACFAYLVNSGGIS